MKYSLPFLILIIVVISGCLKENNGSPVLKKPKVIFCKCQNDTYDKFTKRVEKSYKDSKLSLEKVFYKGKLSDSIIYTYNDYDLLSKEEYYYKSIYNDQKLFSYVEIKSIYDDDLKLIKKIHKNYKIDKEGNFKFDKESEESYFYENGLLVKSCGSCACDEFEYNNAGEVIKRTVFSLKGYLFDTYYYEYRQGHKTKEIKEGPDGNIRYVKDYIYDPFWHLIKVKEDDNIIEENKYFFNKLVEKKTYYFGIDPGYYPCQGNYVATYEY